MNHAIIESLLGTHMYAPAQQGKKSTIAIKFENAQVQQIMPDPSAD
jgi:hypothetical protein